MVIIVLMMTTMMILLYGMAVPIAPIEERFSEKMILRKDEYGAGEQERSNALCSTQLEILSGDDDDRARVLGRERERS